MGIRSQNNPAASYLDKWVATGTDASAQPAAADGHTASGGTINEFAHPDGYVYRAHTFVNSGTFEVTALGSIDSEVDYLVVAGGGGGSQGGGGAGGYRTSVPDDAPGGPGTSSESPFPIGIASYTVVVGGGGGGGGPVNNGGVSGSDSVLDSGGPNPLTSTGGGRGGALDTPAAGGGSGGGGGALGTE